MPLLPNIVQEKPLMLERYRVQDAQGLHKFLLPVCLKTVLWHEIDARVVAGLDLLQKVLPYLPSLIAEGLFSKWTHLYFN